MTPHNRITSSYHTRGFVAVIISEIRLLHLFGKLLRTVPFVRTHQWCAFRTLLYAGSVPGFCGSSRLATIPSANEDYLTNPMHRFERYFQSLHY